MTFDDDPTLPDGDAPLFEGDTDDTPRVLGGRYTLEERLGVGGGAVVWRAFDEALGRTVAVKVLRPGLTDDPEALARLQREAATAGRMPHPGIVAVYDTGRDDGVGWLALEHVAGPTLLDVLRHHPRGLPPQVAAALAEQVAVALGHAHARGLVHRDVKPSNLLLNVEGVVKLADFGVAAAAGATPPELAGSRGYAPPEQLEGRAGADRPPVDVFSLGVVLHECLTGRPAFRGTARRAGATEELLSPRQVRPDVPRDLDVLVRRATRSDPAARYADGNELATALRSLVVADPVELTRALVRPGPHGRAVPAAAPPDDPDPSDDADLEDRPAVGHEPDRLDRRWLLGGVLAAALVALLVSIGLDGRGMPSDDPTVADAGLPVVAIELFDPYGSVGAGASAPGAAVDGDPGTAWSTPTYPVPLRSLGTPGLGLWIDVGAPTAVDEVELALRTGGVTVELLVADAAPTPDTTEADWRSLDRATRPGDRAVLSAQGTEARYWLVWFTELQPVGETWQAALADLRFRPSPTS